ncbi:calcium-binding protein, partial [Methylobacterium sp. Leaf108]|uniref:calcium-binding protein n=1 Tax=Methylobacterium sp. Leaf108 TaxID=1736256 RepID=UPI001AEC6E98
LEGGLGSDRLVGGGGLDWASYAHATTGVVANLTTPSSNTGEAQGDTYSGIENLYGSSFADTLTGNNLANEFEGGAGADRLDGSTGLDTASYAGSTSGVSVDLSAGTATGGHAAGDTLTGIENLRGSAFADTLAGGTGTNVLIGGAGDDLYTVNDTADEVQERAGEGRDIVRSLASSYTLSSNVEELVLLTGAVSGTGNAEDNRLVGNGADNLLDGGAGADTLEGGAGNDTYVVDNLADRVVEGPGGGQDVVRSSLAAYALGAQVENLELLTGALVGAGNELDNRVTGNTLDNLLSGGQGVDTLQGGEGNDVLLGGSGPDRLEGGAGLDTASYAGAAAVEPATGLGLVISLADQSVNTGEATGDTYVEVENLIGSGFADQITGDASDNRLEGGAGADTLSGG